MKYKDMLRYRNVWLGCAMLAILWMHSKINVPVSAIAFLKNLCVGGVDVCLFASGLGCYLSFDKGPSNSKFIKKRFLRIMPTYWVFIVFWIVYRLLCDPIPAWAVLGNFLGIQYLTANGNHLNWYIAALIIYYLLTPYLKIMADWASYRRQLLLVFLLLLVTIPFWCSDTYIIIVARLPIYYLGLVFGRMCRENLQCENRHVIALLLLACLGVAAVYFSLRLSEAILWSYGLYWYPYLLIVPGFCVISAWILQRLENIKALDFVMKGIEKIGQQSFEVYLIHFLIFDIVFLLIGKETVPNTNYVWLVAIICVLLLCPALRYGGKKLEKQIVKLIK